VVSLRDLWPGPMFAASLIRLLCIYLLQRSWRGIPSWTLSIGGDMAEKSGLGEGDWMGIIHCQWTEILSMD
jgi:hypothetical protein